MAQIDFTLNFFDVQSIGTPFYQIPKVKPKVISIFISSFFVNSLKIIPSKNRSIARPVQNGVVGLLNIVTMTSDIIRRNPFRFTFTVNANEFKTVSGNK